MAPGGSPGLYQTIPGSKSMAEKYRPSNGTEGECFQSKWCNNCIHDDFKAEKFCSILGDTLAYDIDDPKYPKEWISDEKGPRCTNFAETLDAEKYHCPGTLDLFNGV